MSAAASISVELMPFLLCEGCGRGRLGVVASTDGKATKLYCRRCRVAHGFEVLAPEATNADLPYILPMLDNVCVCGSSPTHAEHCPAREVRA